MPHIIGQFLNLNTILMPSITIYIYIYIINIQVSVTFILNFDLICFFFSRPSHRMQKSATMSMTLQEQMNFRGEATNTTSSNTVSSSSTSHHHHYQHHLNSHHISAARHHHSQSMVLGLDLSTVIPPPTGTIKMNGKADLHLVGDSHHSASNNVCSIPVIVDKSVPMTHVHTEKRGDSSSGDSLRTTPIDPTMVTNTIDLPSANFEQLLEGKSADALNDSFHSESSLNQDLAGPGLDDAEVLTPQGNTCASFFLDYDNVSSLDMLNSKELNIVSPTKAVDESLISKGSESTCSGDSMSSSSDIIRNDMDHVECCDDMPKQTISDADRTPTQDHPNIITKVYHNQEVRLRGKKIRTISLDTPATFYAVSSDCTKNNKLPVQSQSAPNISKLSPEASPIWKRKSAVSCGAAVMDDSKRMK